MASGNALAPPGGGGSDDPGMAQRVARLEDDSKDVRSTLRGIETAVLEIRADLRHLPRAAEYASLRAGIAEIKGRVSQIPTVLQLVVTVITTWSAGAAIVFTLLRAGR